jgi:SAM-dependent methyltransferase
MTHITRQVAYMLNDVPMTLDFRSADKAREWAESAMSVRPWRTDFFAAFADVIAGACASQPCRVLELGSGPGFLAEQLLKAADLAYVAVDFSATMHELARQRLGELATRVQFIERSLLDPTWVDGLGEFNFAVTHQAVHELRHKRYAPALHAQVRKLLLPGGHYLVCDHFYGEGGMSNAELYMTVDEQREALLSAGFIQVEQVLLRGGLVLHHAT